MSVPPPAMKTSAAIALLAGVARAASHARASVERSSGGTRAHDEGSHSHSAGDKRSGATTLEVDSRTEVPQGPQRAVGELRGLAHARAPPWHRAAMVPPSQTRRRRRRDPAGQYIAPEYLMGGTVSTMNDVYAFGVTILETVSGIRRRYNELRELHLHQWAWKALEGRPKKEFDPALFVESQLVEIKRCIQVGLLCAQHECANRPTMADVLLMLHGEKQMPNPRKPGYIKSTG